MIRSIFVGSFLVLLFAGISIAAEPGLIGYWPFDENSGKTAKDQSGNGYDGEFVGEPNWVPGKFGSALEFDGSSSYVNVPDAPDMAIEKDITFGCWFSPGETIDPGNNAWRLMSKNNDSFLLFNYEQLGHLGWLVKDDGGTNHVVHSTNNTWEAETWYHVAGTYDGQDLTIYIDGVLDNSAPFSGNIGLSALDLWIGADDLTAFFPGAIDEVRMYNRALNEAEVKEWMDGPVAVQPAGKLARTWAEVKSED
ncbi:LamG domain-containing protein [Candidatus Poribacteria bacterium]